MVAASAFVIGLVCAGAIPAWAHVTIAPDSAVKGASDVEITFRVPNEETAASTTKLQVAVPPSPPLLNALAQQVPGWTASVVTTHLAAPIHTDDGDVTDVVSEITWAADSTANGIKPGDFGTFDIIVGTLPSTGDQITFPAVQTYSNGDVVRWIQTQTPGGPAPDKPAPILTLTNPGATATPTTQPSATAPTATASTTGLAKNSAVDSARTIGIVGIVVGALGLVVAGFALASRRKNA